MASSIAQDSNAKYRRRISELEQELNDNQIYNQRLLQQVPALIAIMHGPDHRFQFINQLYIETMGVDALIIGEKLTRVFPELIDQGLVKTFDEVYRTGKTHSAYEERIVLRNFPPEEQEHFFNVVYQAIKGDDGTVTGIFTHAVDVTPLVKARQRSEELAAELEAIFSSMPDGVFIAKDGYITRVNKRGAQSLGYESTADMPRQISDLYEELHLRYTTNGKKVSLKESTLLQALNGKTVSHESVIINNPRTGKQQVMRTAGAPVRDPSGKVIGAISINNDITQQYNLQEKITKNKIEQRVLRQTAKLLKEQNQRLVDLNKSKDEFIALASHQLRTPATSVKQYLGMVLEGYAGEVSSKQREFLDRAYKGNERQLRIVDDILRVAQVDLDKMKLHVQDVAVCELVDYIAEDQAGRFKHRQQKLIVKHPQHDVIIPADHDRLRMAIDNIVDNASKYTGPHKEITVTISGKRDGSAVVIKVHDTGVGIAKDDLPKLFQKFIRIHNPYSVEAGGNGLGLYWTKKIIDLHHGKISVTSRLGQGTTFTITLPTQTEISPDF